MEARRNLPHLSTLTTAVAVTVISLLFHLVQSHQVWLSSAVERAALLDLRSSLGLRGKDWPIKAEPCRSWIGVRCWNGRVTEIDISGLRRTRVGRLNPRFSIDSLASLTDLVSFNASRFSLPGPIPDWLGYNWTSLRVLDLRFSSVSGSIPASLGNLTTLNSLYLSDNNISGTIPSSLSKLNELTVLDLSRNLLTGLIPSSFESLANLTSLELASNYLLGPIPTGLGSLYNLRLLNLSDNSLSASVPASLGNLSRLIELDISRNSLYSSLPVELKGLKSLQRLILGDNELEGPIPDNLFDNLVKLQAVDLSRNKLDGALPNEFWSLPELRFLDLSRNNFTGVLPSFTLDTNASALMLNVSNNILYGPLNTTLSRFSWIDLSSNYFQGEVLDENGSSATLDKNCLRSVPNQKSLEECSLFYEERGLRFDNFSVQGFAGPQADEPITKQKKEWIYVLAGVLGGVALVFVIVLALVLGIRACNKRIPNQRGNANVGPVPQGDVSPSVPKDHLIISSSGDSFGYEQLSRATGNFSENNLIKHGHSGDLFRGAFESGTHFVVKRISLSSSTKENFVTELAVFSKVSHTGLVPFLGYCSEHETEKFLVYKYMPNGDLASSFYRVADSGGDSLQSLDWITRLKIAAGAAEALAYLHHECNPPLVHRDVQASSILLDDKFEVRLGSLSEVCVHQGDGHQNVLTRFLRKPQTSEASHSGSVPTTCSYDVYCFGEVLLELVTGKFGISGSSDETSTKEWFDQTLPYISIYDKDLLNKILDPSLIVDDDLLEEVWAMAVVAKSCLNPKPSKRPPMKYVLKALENPLKVVRTESFGSAQLRTSSRRSWNGALFGSWRRSSSESAAVQGNNVHRDGISGLKQSGRIGSYGSGGIEHSSSRKRFSNEIFPESAEMQDMERQG